MVSNLRVSRIDRTEHSQDYHSNNGLPRNVLANGEKGKMQIKWDMSFLFKHF